MNKTTADPLYWVITAISLIFSILFGYWIFSNGKTKQIVFPYWLPKNYTFMGEPKNGDENDPGSHPFSRTVIFDSGEFEELIGTNNVDIYASKIRTTYVYSGKQGRFEFAIDNSQMATLGLSTTAEYFPGRTVLHCERSWIHFVFFPPFFGMVVFCILSVSLCPCVAVCQAVSRRKRQQARGG